MSGWEGCGEYLLTAVVFAGILGGGMALMHLALYDDQQERRDCTREDDRSPTE